MVHIVTEHACRLKPLLEQALQKKTPKAGGLPPVHLQTVCSGTDACANFTERGYATGRTPAALQAALLAAGCCGGAPRPAAAGCVFEDGIDFSAGKEAQPAGRITNYTAEGVKPYPEEKFASMDIGPNMLQVCSVWII